MPFPDSDQYSIEEQPNGITDLDVSITDTAAEVSSALDHMRVGGEALYNIWECAKGPLLSHLNIRSLVPKFDEIKVMLESFSGAGLVLGFSETWLEEGVTDGELQIDGFRSYRRDRNGRGGGVMVFVSNTVKGVRRCDLESEEIEVVWVQVKLKRKSVLIGNVYRPPGVSDMWFDSLVGMLDKVAQEQLMVVLMGDFNCNMLRAGSHTEKLAMVMSEYGMKQMICDPTRVTQTSDTMIDLLFCSNSDEIIQSGCLELGMSDHEMIYGILNGDKVAQKWCLREIRSFGNCDVDKLVSDLKVAPWSVMETLDDIDDLWEFWKKLFTKVLDSHVPLKRFRVRKKMLPWVSPEIRSLMKQRVFQLKRAKRTKQTEDWDQRNEEGEIAVLRKG